MGVNKQQSLFSDIDAAAAISHLLIYLALSCPSYLLLSLPPQSLPLMCCCFFFSLPVILKVVATLLKNSSPSAELMEVRRLFLSDMIKLFSNSRENRR